MSEKKKKSSTVIDRFGGVDHTRAYEDIASARNIENFRILNDGSLEKRCGYRFLGRLSAPIRTLYSCCINGEVTIYALVENTVFEIKTDHRGAQQIGTVATTSGNACFFRYREVLYLLDGKSIYEYSNYEFRSTEGYVPLVAKDWPTTVPGEIYEPRNILTPHARATYKVDRESIYLCTQDDVESVEALYVNGMLMPPEVYRIDDRFKTINVQNLTIGDQVEIYFTYKNHYDELFERLCSCCSSALFGGIGRNRIFLCGNNKSGTVFSSKSVSQKDIEQSRKLYPESGGLYFPLGYEFEAGDGIAEIKAITRLYDHLIIFTENDVWIVNPDDDMSDLATTSSANAKIGCPVNGGATLSENLPVSIGHSAIFIWNSVTGKELRAENISLPISQELNHQFLRGCGIYYDITRNELWIYNRTSSRVWIYNTVVKAWYSFTNIKADTIFDMNGSVAFTYNGEIYYFDESSLVDYDANNLVHPISALYVSNYSNLGESGKKNLRDVTIRAELSEDVLSFSLNSPMLSREEYKLKNASDSEDIIKKFRYSANRFEYASFSFISAGIFRPKIHSLTLTQRKAGKKGN